MDPTAMIYTHVVPKKNHVMNGKEHAIAMMSVWALWNVVNQIAISLAIHQTIVDSKNLTVAIQVCISILKRCNHWLIISSLLFCLALRSLSCNSLNSGTNSCEELDSICMIKKIGTFLFYYLVKKDFMIK